MPESQNPFENFSEFLDYIRWNYLKLLIFNYVYAIYKKQFNIFHSSISSITKPLLGWFTKNEMEIISSLALAYDEDRRPVTGVVS